MNAKKETGYMFADITLAINEIAEALGKKENIINMANIDPKPRTSESQAARRIHNEGPESPWD